MFSRVYYYNNLRVIVFSKEKNPRVASRGVVIYRLKAKLVIIKSTDSDSKATIAGFDNLVQIRDALNEIIEIRNKQKARKNKKKKK